MAEIKTTLFHGYELAVFSVLGECDLNELSMGAEDFYANDTTLNALWIFSHAVLPKVSHQETEAIVQQDAQRAKLRNGGKTAIVQPDDLGFGLTRAYESLSAIYNSPTQIRAFRTVEEACLWLDVDVEDISSGL